MCFLYLEVRKNVHRTSRKRAKPRNVFFFGLKVLGAFYSPGVFFEVTALVGPPSSNGLGSG